MTRSCTSLRTATLPLLGLWTLLGTGCEVGPKPTNQEILSQYQAGRYSQAFEMAGRLAASGPNQDRDQAKYMAGMSAYRLNRHEEALRYLTPLAGHVDSKIAGTANATLGLIHAQMGRHDKAVNYFKEAAGKLMGNDAAQAYYHLALCEEKSGRAADARAHLSLASGKTTDESLKEKIRQLLQETGYTLQLGAYTNAANANQRASALRVFTERAGLGLPRVVASPTASGTLYLVQAGRFASHTSALTARRQLTALTDVIIRPLGRP